MKLVSGIVDSGFFAQSALSAGIATKDSNGNEITSTYITAHQSLPNSASWNSTYNTVSNNSASWAGGSTYTGDAQGALDEVYSNSANWNTVTDKLDSTAFSTVSGSFLTAVPEGYATTGDLTNKLDTSAQVVTATGGDNGCVTAINGSGLSGQAEISLPILNSAANGTIYYSAKYDTNHVELLQGNSTAWKIKAGITPYGASASGNGGYVTLSNNNMYCLYQTGSSIARSYKIDATVPNITLIKGSDKGVVNISSISGWNSAFSAVSSNSGSWNDVVTTVSTNSASWTGGDATLPVSGSAGENSAVYGLYDMKIECNSPSVGGSEPEHTYVQAGTNLISVYESYDEDQSYNQVTIAPSYIEFYNNADGYVDLGSTDVLDWESTHETVSNNSATWSDSYNTVTGNSANWGTASLGISAGPGIAIQVIDGILLISTASV